MFVYGNFDWIDKKKNLFHTWSLPNRIFTLYFFVLPLLISFSSRVCVYAHSGKNHISSESESSSSTEIEVSRKSFSPNTIRKRKLDKQLSERLSYRNDISDDEDATFNELMGKFDESYIYEKETDILSDDSDPTECASDLDTGQDGGDECETDELLDIDYIDTGSIQEVVDKDIYKNTGSCTYFHNNQAIEKRGQSQKLRKSRKQQSEDGNSSRRRKRLTRTRKRNSECRDSSQNSRKTNSPNRFRESRSVGGTPVSLRRNRSESRHQRFVSFNFFIFPKSFRFWLSPFLASSRRKKSPFYSSFVQFETHC